MTPTPPSAAAGASPGASGGEGRSLAGKTVLMSGGSRGIGLAIALRAARDGANIALLAKTDTPHPKLEGTVHTAAEAIRAAGGNALPIVGDVRIDADITAAVLKTRGEFGGIDIVVNNASVIDLSRSLDLSAKKYDLMQDVNVRGTFMLSRAAIPMLKEAADPHILSLSPPLNLSPKWLGAHTGYTLAKYGMTMVTLGLAAEFARDGIAANTLWPRTTIATAAVQFALGGDAMMKVSRTPEIYADAAHAVLTTPSRELTGQTLVVEDVLEQAGVTDFSGYAAVPGTPDDQLFPDIFLD
ncbi:SDR family oxidoreductase [Microbacterium sp.]|uniref:SDR family oxidoreductase n=1 Tax=Microbacterium sp. TaxID=51671 RepID=UPI0037C6322A